VGKAKDAVIIIVVLVALVLAILLIAIPMRMISSNDIVTKVEGALEAPLLIGAGVAIILALLVFLGKRK
jgi:hypothetical protein